MAEKGFNEKGVKLYLPPFLRGSQFSEDQVVETRDRSSKNTRRKENKENQVIPNFRQANFNKSGTCHQPDLDRGWCAE